MAITNIPTQKLIVPSDTNVAVGCVVTGGFANDLSSEVKVIDVEDRGNFFIVTINQVPFSYTVDKVRGSYTVNVPRDVTVDTNGSYMSNITFTCKESSFGSDALVPTDIIHPKTVSFKENVKGWVSFKSFTPENAISMANDYYTFFNGKIFLHHVESVDRNTFYLNEVPFPHAASSIDVILNDSPSAIKEFNTLNYEGSQANINKFVYKPLLSLPFQPPTSYSDQEFYNLSEKIGWNVESIITNDEDGYIDEFLEKEGKWFNNIKRKIDLSLEKADTGDFSFQGIGLYDSIQIIPPNVTSSLVYGCTDPLANNYNPGADVDDGSCIYDEGGPIIVPPPPASRPDYPCYRCNGSILESSVTNFIVSQEDYICPEGWSKQIIEDCGGRVVRGCMDPLALNYNPNATVDDGNCTYAGETIITNGRPTTTVKDEPVQPAVLISGCTDPESTNYNPNAVIDDGSCYFIGSNACAAISATEACTDWGDLVSDDPEILQVRTSIASTWTSYFNSQPGFYITVSQLIEQLDNCCGNSQIQLQEK